MAITETYGVWWRLQVERTPLPAIASTGPGVVAVGNRTLSTRNHLPPKKAQVQGDDHAQALPDDIAELRGRLSASVKKVGIPPLSHRTHPLIAKLLERDEKRGARIPGRRARIGCQLSSQLSQRHAPMPSGRGA